MSSERARLIHLLIGLGGLGAEAVLQAGQLISSEASLSSTHSLSVLGIDTDRSVFVAKSPPYYEGYLLPTEQIQAVRRRLSDYPNISSWLPAELPEPDNGRGVLGSKALGRLALHVNYAELRQKLTQAIINLHRASQSDDKNTPIELRVFLVASLGGGTGSGLLCDLGYLIQRIANEAEIPYTCDAIILAGHDASDDMRASNLYASLVELNHWMSQFTEYEIEPVAGEPWKSTSPPFRRCYIQAVKSLRDASEIDTLFGQVASIVGLSVLPEEADVQAKIVERLLPYDGSFDDTENPTSFYSVGSSSIYLPTNNLAQIIESKLAVRVIGQWLDTLFHTPSKTDEIDGAQMAESFMIQFGLKADELSSELRHGIETAKNSIFSVSNAVESFLRQQEKLPEYGEALVEKLRSLDQHLERLYVSKAVSQLLDFVAEETNERLLRCTEAVNAQCESFVNDRHRNCLVLRAFITDLDRQISAAANELHESLTRRHAAELNHSGEKEKAIREAVKLAPSAWQRLRGKFSQEPLTSALDAIQQYYGNKIHILADQGALQICFDTLQLLNGHKEKLDILETYLTNTKQALVLLNERCSERMFKRPGEALASQDDINQLIEKYSVPKDSENVIDEIVDVCGGNLYTLPGETDPAFWQEQILKSMHKLSHLPETHVAVAFLRAYSKARTNDRIRLLFEQSSPNLLLDSNGVPVAETSYASMAVESEKDKAAIDTILERLHAINTVPAMEIIAQPASSSISIYRVAGGFALKDLDLSACKAAYLQSLRLGMRYLHSRTDVKFYALGRPSIEQVTSILEELAVGMHLGLIKSRPFDAMSTNHDEIDALYSPRLPDLSSVKACLRIYADPLEALHVESAFIKSLARWRSEKLDENGVVVFLQSLENNTFDMSFLGLDLNDSLPSARQTIRQTLEEKWSAWSNDIRNAIAKSPTVRTTDLVSVPNGVRLWAMLRYIKENPEENLAYHQTSGVLELVSARDVENLDSIWMRFQSALERDYSSFEEASQHLVQFLSQALGFTQGRRIGLGSMTGMQVGVHGLRIKLPSSVPILVNRHKRMEEEDIASVRTILEQGGLDCRFCLLITAGNKQENIDAVNEHLRNLLRYDVIILTYDDIRSIIKVKSRTKALVKLIVSQVDLTVVSPFVTEGPVPASMFFGREGEIRIMLLHLDKASVAVIGPRRVGKTSILQRVLATLRSKSGPVVYLDCQSVFDTPSLLAALAMEYAPTRIDNDFSTARAFRPLLDTIRANSAGACVQFILDEVDLLLREDPAGSEALFRAFKVASQENAAHFLFCGERTLLQKLYDHNSALYNFCHTVRVRYLEPGDATLLITQPFEQMEIGWENREASVKMILEYTSCHPNIVQRACSMILEQLNAENTRLIRKCYVEGVLNSPDFIDEYLETLWGRADELEKIVCLALEKDDVLSAQQLRERLLQTYEVDLSVVKLVEAMDNLCLYGILEKQGSRYAIAAGHLPIVLHDTLDIPDEIKLYREMMALNER